MASLLVRLNTYESINNATLEEQKFGAGIYVDFDEGSEDYKRSTFKNVIGEVIISALDSEEQYIKNLAGSAKYLLTKKIPQTVLTIGVYDHKNDRLKQINLEDEVTSYIAEHEITYKERSYKVDYLDIIIGRVTWD